MRFLDVTFKVSTNSFCREQFHYTLTNHLLWAGSEVEQRLVPYFQKCPAKTCLCELVLSYAAKKIVYV